MFFLGKKTQPKPSNQKQKTTNPKTNSEVMKLNPLHTTCQRVF